MPILKFDRSICGALAVEVETALAGLAAKHGLSVKRAGGKFSDGEWRMNLDFKVTDVAARVSAETKSWNANCAIFDLEPSDYGAKFTNNGQEYVVIGFTNRPKYPFKARKLATGEETCFTDMVAQIIKRNRAAA
jgi:hypothetical protein